MAESSREEIAKLEALYASNPEGRVFTHLAEALRKAGELDRARTILEEGLVKHPAYASAHVVLGRVLLDQQSPAEAADAFRRVHALDPHNHVALRSLGDIARKAGNNAEALQYFEELRTLDPGNEELNATIEELSAAPAVMAQPVAAEPEPAEPEPEPEPEPEAAPPVSAATDFEEWAPSSTAEQLPGDLAGLAGFESADELPTFEDVDPLAELTALNTSFDAATPEAPPEADLGEPLPTADFSFDGPAEEEPVLDIDALAPLPEFEPADAPLPAAAPAPAPIADAETAATGEVVTETIAELYRSQGLYDRAADVYRTLLAQRPGDSTLEQKLQEVEDLAAGPIPVPQPEPVFPTEPWESPATWRPEPQLTEPPAPAAPAASGASEQAEAWLAGGEGATESAPTPYAWAEQAAADETDGGAPISAYFQKLLAWKPSTPAVSSPSPSPAPSPSGLADIEMERDTMLLLDEAVDTGSVETTGFYETSEPAPPPPAQDPWMAAEPPAIQEPWEAPMPQAPEAAAPAPPPAPATPAPTSSATTSEDAFDEWFGAPEPPEGQSHPHPQAQPQSQSPSPEESSPDDDDDLEMFRSWLQSLKK